MAASEPPERALRDHLGVLRRHLGLVLGLPALAVIVAVAVSLAQSPRYTATATVLVAQETLSTQRPTDDRLVNEKRLDPARIVQDEQRLATSGPVRDEAARQAGGAVTYTVNAPKDADVLEFVATAGGGDEAARAANSAANAYVQVRHDDQQADLDAAAKAVDAQLGRLDERVAALDATTPADATGRAAQTGARDALAAERETWAGQQRQIAGERELLERNGPRVVAVAAVPANPTSPALGRTALLAAALGLVLGIAAAYTADHLDDRIRTLDDLLRVTGLPALGTMARAWPEPSPLRVLRVDDELLAEIDEPLPVADVVEHTGGTPVVLAVRVGTRGRQARQVADAFTTTGVRPIGAVLASATPPPS